MDAPQEDHTRHSRDSSSADSADGLLQSAAPLPGADDDVEAAVVGSSHSSGGGWGLGGALPALLPPLPQPKVEVMKQESARGCLLVLFVITVCLAATHSGATLLRSENLSTAFLITIYIEAGLALGCLVGLMYGDPGVVQRTPQTALPVPQKVRVLLERTPPQYPRGNITDGQLGTYCVRCYLWRDSQPGRPDCASRYLGRRIALCAPVPKRSHHCSTCQRCVVDFDHHCGVFGRCIAGQGFAGNMGFFKLIITCGSWGSITATSCVVIGWTEQMGWSGFAWAVGGLIGLLLLWQVCGCVLRLHFHRQRMEAAKRRQQAERSRMPPQAEVEVSTAGARRSMAAEVSAGTQ